VLYLCFLQKKNAGYVSLKLNLAAGLILTSGVYIWLKLKPEEHQTILQLRQLLNVVRGML